MYPVCAPVRLCIRPLVCRTDFSKTKVFNRFGKFFFLMDFYALRNILGFLDFGLK